MIQKILQTASAYRQVNMSGHKDLKVYQLSYRLAMEIFDLSKGFPKEETYSLTDQIRRSSRSITANIAEAYRKRQYPNAFIAKLSDSDAECSETQTWLDYSRDCGYLSKENCERLNTEYEQVGRMIGGMIANPDKFAPKRLKFAVGRSIGQFLTILEFD